MTVTTLSREPLARGLVDFFGGPRGTHASRPVNAMRWVLSVGWVFLAFAYLAKANCAGGIKNEDGTVSLNWAGARQYTSFCYNDIIPLYGGRGLDKPGFVYAYSWQEGDLTRYMEYPVLAGLFQGFEGWLARTTYPLVSWAVADAGWYFALTALTMAIMWVATLRMVGELLGNRLWDGLLVAASPLVIMHGFTNWDIPSITLAVAALLAVSKRKNWLGGVLIGLGFAFKMWPLFMLGAFLVLAIRHRRFVPFFKLLGGAVGAAAVVNIPIALLYPDAWYEFFRLNSTRGWEWTTVYAMIARNFPNLPMSAEFVNAFSLVGFLALCVGILIFGLRTQRTPRVAELVFLILVAFLMLNKVWSPQYSLWLLVPAVLALPNWRLIFAWGFFDALVWPILMLHMHGVENKGLPGEMLDLAIYLRDGFILAIAVLVIRQMLGKSRDKVLADNGTDLLAGDFAK